MIDRTAALDLLHEFVASPALRQHCLAVEAAVRGYAARLGADVELWGLTGLLHDFDYERYPNAPDHPLKGSEVLRERGYPEEAIYAILSHADYLTDTYPRTHLLDKVLYACDELSGFVVAVSKVQPDGLRGVKVESVKKKLKQKSFAQAVKREDIDRGAAELGVPLDEHIGNVVESLRGLG